MKLSLCAIPAVALATTVLAMPQAVPAPNTNTNGAITTENLSGPTTLSFAASVATNATCDKPETLAVSFFRVPAGRTSSEVCSEFTSRCGALGDGEARLMSTSCGFNQGNNTQSIVEVSCIMSQNRGNTFTYARNVSDSMNLDLVYWKPTGSNCTELPDYQGWCHDETYDAQAPQLCVPAKK